MTKDNLLTRASDSRYIEGVYNYCDRWCERCPLTARCLNYAIAEEEFGVHGNHDLENAAFWDTLKDMFELTLGMLSEWAEEHGVDLDDIDMEAAAAAEQQRREHAHSHPLSQAAEAYTERAETWFAAETDRFAEREDELKTLVTLGVGGDEPFDEADGINDAVEVVQWYRHQIHVKLMRALSQWFDDPDEAACVQSDANGSVKVALIGMDRSLAAWGALREFFPGCADEVLDILIDLDRLRRQTEQAFPQARAFIRPGFDA